MTHMIYQRTPADDEYDRKESAAHAELRPHLTPEFLATLRLAAEIVSWEVDMIEVDKFVEAAHRIAGQEMLPLHPREYGPDSV